jgi:hypothetical protein
MTDIKTAPRLLIVQRQGLLGNMLCCEQFIVTADIPVILFLLQLGIFAITLKKKRRPHNRQPD